MSKVSTKTHRADAFLYAFFAFSNFALIGVVFSILGWHGINQFVTDLEMVSVTIAPIFFFAFTSLIMSFLSWSFVDHSKLKKRIVTGVAITLVVLSLCGFVTTMLNESSTLIQKLFPLSFIVGYSIPAFNLMRGARSNHSHENRTG